MSRDTPDTPLPWSPALQRLREAAQQADSADWPVPVDGLTWQTAVEELGVAEEELRQQNEELLAASGALEAERQRYHELFNFAPDCLWQPPFLSCAAKRGSAMPSPTT